MIAKLRHDKDIKPHIYIKIEWDGGDTFYGNLGERREEVDYQINRFFNYLDSVGGWTWLGEDKFLNNPIYI